MASSIESEQGNNSDIASGNYCSDCAHNKNEHSIGKCYGLNFNGTVYSNCLCKKFINNFTIKATIYENTIAKNREGETKRFIPTFRKVS